MDMNVCYHCQSKNIRRIRADRKIYCRDCGWFEGKRCNAAGNREKRLVRFKELGY